MGKLNLKHRIAALLVVFSLSLFIGLVSCNSSSETTETKTDTSKMENNKMQGDTTNKDTSGKGEQVPPPKN
jgi:hypothetical protein